MSASLKTYLRMQISFLTIVFRNSFPLRIAVIIYVYIHVATASNGQGPPQYRGFTITLRRTTLGRFSLDE
jgi:hypothetical protein